MTLTERRVAQVVLGLGLGFALSRMGFSSFDQVHQMFLFTDLRLFLTFAGGVSLTAVGFTLLRRARPLAPQPLHSGVVPGAMLFGAGWALCGACPGIVLVQLGEGQAAALLTFAGMLLGNWLAGQLQRATPAAGPVLPASCEE